MRAAAYVRQSVDQSEGIDRQLARTRALIEARGWELVAAFEDNAVTATRTRGAGTAWAKMLAALDQGDIEAVVAVDLDRLVRSTRDLNVLVDAGAKVVAVDGAIDLSTADGEFRATMLASIARFETRRKSERQLRANEHRVSNGLPIGRARAIGYEPGGMLVREGEASVIRAGYESLLAGVGLAQIGRDWVAAGVVSDQSKTGTWMPSAVRRVIENPRNAALMRHNGRTVGAAAWPAIVPEETFHAAVALLSDPTRRVRQRGGQRVLTGLALCGACEIDGLETTVHQSGARSRDGRKFKAYRCRRFHHLSRAAEPVERFVVEVFVSRLLRPDAADLLVTTDRADIAELRAEAQALRADLDNLAALVADRTLTPDSARRAAAKLKDSLAAVEARQVDAGRVDVLGPLVRAEDVWAVWDAWSPDRQRAALAAVFERIVIAKTGPGRYPVERQVRLDWRE